MITIKKIIAIACAGFLVFGLFSFLPKEKSDDKTGIQFIEQDWKAALEKAKAEHKLIFLDAYASWCGPCKMLKKNTFSQKDAGDYFNENYINVAVDMEKGVGPELGIKYTVEAYPTLIVADENGKLITYTAGYMDAKKLIEFGKYAQKQANK